MRDLVNLVFIPVSAAPMAGSQPRHARWGPANFAMVETVETVEAEAVEVEAVVAEAVPTENWTLSSPLKQMNMGKTEHSEYSARSKWDQKDNSLTYVL